MESILDMTKARKYSGGETVFTESVGEYTLPDYLPEMRKLLRIETRLLPTGQYVGNNRVEMTGTTVHTVIYSDGEGRLSSAVLNGDYRFAVPLSAEGDVQVLVESRPERVSYRLGGPRRLSIRTGISSNVRLLPETVVGGEELPDKTEGFERLMGVETVCDIRRVYGEGVTLDDQCRLDGLRPDEVRSVAGDATVFVREARPQVDGIYCSGEVWAKVLYVSETGDSEFPETVWRKIPFDVMIPDAAGAGNALVRGYCTSFDVDAEDDGLGNCQLIIRMQLDFEGASYTNREIAYVRDMYARHAHESLVRESFPLARFHGCATQNFTVSGSTPMEEAWAGARAVDAFVTPENMVLEAGDNRVKISGDCRVEAILRLPSVDGEGTPQYERAEFVFPVKMELDGKVTVPEGADVPFSCNFLGGQMRLDGQSLRMDGEMAVSLAVLEPKTVTTVTKAETVEGEETGRSAGDVIVAYPDSGETLWSVAKRYRADLQKLMQFNQIPERFTEEPDAPSSIDGMSSLLIC